MIIFPSHKITGFLQDFSILRNPVKNPVKSLNMTREANYRGVFETLKHLRIRATAARWLSAEI